MDIREQIASDLFWQDWDEENGFAIRNATNGSWEEQTDKAFREHYLKRADQILSLPGIMCKAENQELPDKDKLHTWFADDYGEAGRIGYDLALEDMLQGDKTGYWVKVKRTK